MKPAAFLDRDGVLNVDREYVCSAERFEWVTRAPEAVRLLNERGYLVFVVSNQSGIARGYYSEAQFLEFTQWMLQELHKRGARVDELFYCPHHATQGVGKYRVDCDCRKPKTGMIEQAFAKWPIDRERSFLIGDQDTDIAAARTAGIAGHLFAGGDLELFVKKILG